MAPTPEGKVKKMVREYLDSIPGLWYYMPVSMGMGVHGIPDFVGCYKGRSFFIETKAPGKGDNLSALQVRQKKLIEEAGGAYFVVDGEESLQAVKEWVVDAEKDSDWGDPFGLGV